MVQDDAQADAPHVQTLQGLIRDVPDWPQPGIVFKDITPLLADPAGLALAVEHMAIPFRGTGVEVVCGAESRGFIFGTALAQALSAGFIPIRKPDKLPCDTQSITYDLEYGQDTLEVDTDAVAQRKRVLMVDDLLATGGTMKACCDLIERLGGEVVGVTVLIELGFLEGRARLGRHGEGVHSVLRY
jgi:adenine phosphoribosyltransferase